MTQKERFERGLQATIRYKSGNGDNPNSPTLFIDSEGYKLGVWQSGMRIKRKKAALPSEWVEELEKIGFVWDLQGKNNNENFKKVIKETLRYKEENNGNPNAPRKYVTPEGFKLAVWQDNFRKNFSRESLSEEVIKAFSDIGFAWKKQEWEFEKHFKATLEFMKRNNDNPNAPTKYKDPKGYKLGAWQNSLRTNYNKGKLSAEKIKRLEGVGFVWRVRGAKIDNG